MSRGTCEVAATVVQVQRAMRKVGAAAVQVVDVRRQVVGAFAPFGAAQRRVARALRQIRSSLGAINGIGSVVLETLCHLAGDDGQDVSTGERVAATECHRLVEGDNHDGAPGRANDPDRRVLCEGKRDRVSLRNPDVERRHQASAREHPPARRASSAHP